MSCACTKVVRSQILWRVDVRIERSRAEPDHRYRRSGERFAAWLWRHGFAGLPGQEIASRRETIGRHTAHLNRLDEVTIHYRFHPLRSQCLPVVRRCELYGDAYYILRRPDGRPLAVPEWMTRPDMAKTTIVSSARLPAAVLIALRREVVTCLSCCEQIVQEENRDVSTKDQTSAAAVRRSSSTSSSRRFPASGAGATLPGAEALDSGPGGHDAQGGRR